MSRPIGFSTGAIAKGDYRKALQQLGDLRVPVVELSALRMAELEPLVQEMPRLDLASFRFVSFHAPSRFAPEEERRVVERVRQVAAMEIPVVVHPDVICDFAEWQVFEELLLIENMDRRKKTGATAAELEAIFSKLPAARFCFDIGHARQIDPTMAEARRILEIVGERLAEVHISEVNENSEHQPISEGASEAFQRLAKMIPERTPVVVESMIAEGQGEVEAEIRRAARALGVQ
jgi:sugar phosphate isomerase/epimerase